MSNSVVAVPGAPPLDLVLLEHYCHPDGTYCEKGKERWHSLWKNINEKSADSGRCAGRICVARAEFTERLKLFQMLPPDRSKYKDFSAAELQHELQRLYTLFMLFNWYVQRLIIDCIALCPSPKH